MQLSLDMSVDQQTINGDAMEKCAQYLNSLSQNDPEKLNHIMEELGQNNEGNKDLHENTLQEVLLPGGKTQLKIDGTGTERKEDGILITPTAAFVLKSKSIAQAKVVSTKVFINACSNDHIDEPSAKKSLDENGKEIEGLNVPVAVGPIRDCYDKSGVMCKVVDCIVHPTVIENCNSVNDPSGSNRHFICQFLLRYVSSKYEELGELDERYKLPKLNYKGYVDSRTGTPIEKTSKFAEVCKQWVKDTSKRPTIEEIDSSQEKTKLSTVSKKNLVTTQVTQVKKMEMEMELYLKASDGHSMHLADFIKAIKPKLDEPILSLTQFENNMEYPTLGKLCFSDDKNSFNLPWLFDLPTRDKLISNDRNFQPFELCLKTKLLPKLVESMDISISTSMCIISVPHFYLRTEYVFPFPIVPKSAKSEFDIISGILTITATFAPDVFMDRDPDPGSQAWKLQYALAHSLNAPKDHHSKIKDCSGKDDSNQPRDVSIPTKMIEKNQIKQDNSFNHQSFNHEQNMRLNPSSYFHLDSPSLSKILSPSSEHIHTEIPNLPEDQFHAKDVVSMYMMEQQEKEKENRMNKAKDQKAEQAHGKDDMYNIEYLKVEDFRPGGKYNSPVDSSLKGEECSDDHESNHDGACINVMQVMKKKNISLDLSNNLWANLLI